LFSLRDRKNINQYLHAIELSKTVSNKSEIARIINQANRTVQSWIKNEQIPIAVRAINELKENNLLPLVENNNSDAFNLFVEIFAFIYGDGSLKKDLFGFDLFGQKQDLSLMKREFEERFDFKTKIIANKTVGEITKENKGIIFTRPVVGSVYRLRVYSSQFAKLLYLAGAPKGDKVAQPTSVPSWLMNSSKETKRRFLSVLFGNELQCPQLRAKNAFTSPQFGLHKIESKQSELKIFLEQIKQLLNEFGISTSPISFEKCKTIRKDGNHSMKLYFHIDSHSPNILHLFKEIPFKYAEEKQKRFEKAVQQFLKNSEHLKHEWKLYEKVLEMHSNGLGRRTIFKKLELPKKYFYKINAWIHYGNKPLYYEEREILFSFNP